MGIEGGKSNGSGIEHITSKSTIDRCTYIHYKSTQGSFGGFLMGLNAGNYITFLRFMLLCFACKRKQMDINMAEL